MASQYLAQALSQMAQPMPAATQGPDLVAMAAQAKQRKEWERANPGQSYAQHGMQQGIASLQGVPQRLGQVPGQLAGLLSLGATG